MNKLLGILCILLGTFTGCEKEPFPHYDGPGKRPVYLPEAQLKEIKNLPPQPIQLSGTIFVQDTFFYLLDVRKGIHVFSIADPANPAPLTFWNIPAIGDFTISGNRLYVDSWRDLVTIDMADKYQIREINRQSGAFEPLLFPPLYNGFFECVDESKGAITGWEDAELVDARCRTVN